MRLEILILAVLAFLSGGLPASAVVVSKPCIDLLLPPSYWITQREELQKELRSAPQILATQLEKSADEILSVNYRINNGDYGVVHSVKTQSHEKVALKIYDHFDTEDPSTEFAQTVLIQRLLGQLSAAPQVFGVLQEAELEKLLIRFPELKPSAPKEPNRVKRKARFAVLMEEIPDALLVKVFLDAFRVRITRLPTEARNVAIAKMDYLQTTLNRLRIFPYDAQVLVSESTGNVVVQDLDLYTIVTEKGSLLGNLKRRREIRDLPATGEHGYLEMRSWVEWLKR